MRIFLKSIFFIFSTTILSAQIPNDYYITAENKADNVLKFELNQIISNHTTFPYTSSSTDTWDILKKTDKDPNNDNNVILIYSGVSVDASQEYNIGNGWTREHIWAKSRGDFGTAEGPGSDVHALRPLDNTTNSIRNNRGFNNCSDCEDVYDQWSNFTGSKKDNTEWSFEPRDEVKGDIARMLFYMAVRYEGYDLYLDLELSENILPSNDNAPLHAVLSTLIEWHRNDPVDAWEQNRNDIIYYSYQKNRNPFIDHPEIVEHLWGNQVGVEWNSLLFSLADNTISNFIIYPSAVSEVLFIKNSTNSFVDVVVYNLLGKKVLFEKNTNTLDVRELPKGVYIIQITNDLIKINKKFVKD
jgi:endonuclease I|tara:strand:- start:73 stop:1140 length:1068 start_codon:yes stop_codon:yes gene_type:complete